MRRCGIVVLIASAIVGIGPTAHASFPGTNGAIAYYDFRELFGDQGVTTQIYSIQPDGTGKQQLTTTSFRDEFDPAYSADGTMIAFASNATSDPARGRIYLMDADGQNVTLVTRFERNQYVTSPTWSPDGTRIAFCMQTPANRYAGSIFVVKVDGTGRHNISGGHADCLPDWSPDGTRLVVDTRTDHGYKLLLMEPDGSHRRTLVERGWNVDASWSPDGTAIAFIREVHEPRFSYDLFTIDVATRERTNLTPTPQPAEWAPAWSPDGTAIAFERGPTIFDPADIFIIELGVGTTRVTDTPDIDEYEVSWQPL
jgi:Tol biopolymer transport system component